MKPRRFLAVAALVLLLPACTLESLPGLGQAPEEEASPRPGATDLQVDRGNRPPASEVADIVSDVLPSVVNVRVRALQTDDFGFPQEQEGQGSGVIIDDGVILTNNHVVQCAVDVDVVTNDGSRLTGTVVGTAPENDLAIIRVDADAQDLTPLTMGSSSDLRLGDGVIALGFPLGLGGPTVTRGIISGVGRSIEPQGGTPLEGLLQTDAAINPGNSGGALVDMAGQLVGINTAGAQAGTAENIGFAIPIDTAIPIADDILEGRGRAWLGVSILSVNSAAIASQLGLDPDLRGAAIRDFLEGPAEEAGLEVGDVIVRVGDMSIESADDLTEALAAHDPEDRVEIEIVREGERATVEVELAERPPPEELSRQAC